MNQGQINWVWDGIAIKRFKKKKKLKTGTIAHAIQGQGQFPQKMEYVGGWGDPKKCKYIYNTLVK